MISAIGIALHATGPQAYGTNLIMRKVGVDTLTYMYNGHADVTALLDSSGNLVATYYYDAFGNILEKTGTAESSILYGGYQYDEETGLYYLNARMYDPVTARFLQQDTYKGQYNDPLSLNLYTYCHNEPLMYSDPTGHREVVGHDVERETEMERTQSLYAMNNGRTETAPGYDEYEDAQALLEAQHAAAAAKGKPTSTTRGSRSSDSQTNIAVTLKDLATGINIMNQIEAEVIFGAVYGALNSIGFGQLPEFYHSNSTAYNLGKALGDIIAGALGVIGIAAGAGGTAGGVVLSATGVGAVAGAPISAGSLALIGISSSAVVTGATNAGKDLSNAINNSSNIVFDSGARNFGNSGKSQLKKFGSNSAANEAAKEVGYESAEVFKEEIVGRSNIAKLNMKYDPKTGEIILESIQGSTQVPTGYYLP